jgi:hypothetical protein
MSSLDLASCRWSSLSPSPPSSPHSLQTSISLRYQRFQRSVHFQ